MKKDVLVLIVAMFVIVAIAFMIFNYKVPITGFVVSDTEENESVSNINVEEALSAIADAELIIENMKKNNLSVILVDDLLAEAKVVFEQVKYANILRNESAGLNETSEAKKALELVNWEGISYSDIVEYTDKIKGFEDMAFVIFDRIALEEKTNEGISLENLRIFDNAKIAFNDERYNEAERLLNEFKTAKEEELAGNSSLSAIKAGAQNFIQRYWLPLIITLIFVIWLINVVRKIGMKRRLKNKIKRMKFEENALAELMKKAQTDRFKENKISGLVYNIRMNNYKNRANEIKEKLPVLEARLRKMS